MKPFLIRALQKDNYKAFGLEVSGGSRPRITLGNTRNNHKFFFKAYLHNPRELWAEMFASRFGKEIEGFSVQIASIHTASETIAQELNHKYRDYLPKNWNMLGVLIDNAFPKDFEIKYAHSLLDANERDSFSFEDVREKIHKKYSYSNPKNILQSFVHMIVFDAIIGNMDRHLENWGILEHKTIRTGQIVMNPKEDLQYMAKFTPFFDNGSSCLFEMEDSKVDYYLNNKERFRKDYVLGKPYSLMCDRSGSKKNVFDIIEDHCSHDKEWKKLFKKSIDLVLRVGNLNIAKVIFKMPNEPKLEYSTERKELLFRSILTRVKILEEIRNQFS